MIVFISYSREDSYLADSLRRALATCGVRVWIDRKALLLGDPIERGIEGGIEQSDYVLLLASKTSLRSDWVEKEWEQALELESAAEEVRLLVVKLDGCELPAELSDKVCVNLSEGQSVVAAEIVRRLAPRLLSELREQTGVPYESEGELGDLLEDLYEQCGGAHDSRLRHLLATAWQMNFRKPFSFPLWAPGVWLSDRGWNEGEELEFTPRPHGVFSANAYGYAHASFQKSLVNGVLTTPRLCGDHVAAFSWYQEVGGNMSGVTNDSGQGFLWQYGTDRLRALWWFDNVPDSLPQEDKKSQLHPWRLRRVQSG